MFARHCLSYGRLLTIGFLHVFIPQYRLSSQSSGPQCSSPGLGLEIKKRVLLFVSAQRWIDSGLFLEVSVFAREIFCSMLIQVIFKGSRKEKRKGVQGVQSSTAVAEGAALMGTAPCSNLEVGMLQGSLACGQPCHGSVS